ncbi:MAG: PAS domain S-box protein [bacterium]|nr:PAS domain S-box protein [bacterium]
MLRQFFSAFGRHKDASPAGQGDRSPGPDMHARESALQFSELRYRRLFETAQDGILILDADTGKIEDVNPFLETMLGYSHDEFVGKELWEIGVFNDIADSKSSFMELQAKGYIRYKDLPLQSKDGRSIAVEFISNAYVVGDQRVIQCNIRDISDRKLAERKAAMQTAALKAAANGIAITDVNAVIQWVNPAFIALTGYTRDELLGQQMRILRSGKQNKMFYEKFWKTILSGRAWKGEIINRKKDGSLYIGEQMITPIIDEKGKATTFITITQDVTDRKKLEQSLTSRNAELERLAQSHLDTQKAMLNVMEDLEETRALIELERAKDEAMLASIGEGLIAVDNEGKVIMMNKIAEEILGWKISELQGKAVTNLPLEDEAGTPMPSAERPTTIALATGKIIKVTFYFVRKDKTRFPIAITATPVIFGKKTIGLIEIFRDISKELAVDKAKSEFVSLASHQLRTPLGIMKWYIEALETEEYSRKAPVAIRKYLAEIYKSNERVLSLVRDLLSVSRIEQGRVKNVPKEVDLVHEIVETIDQLQIVARKKKIPLRVTVRAPKSPRIASESMRFHEVVQNVVANALEYTTTGSVDVIIEKDGTMLCIRVKDTGIGISSADQKKLFTKFFRSEKAVSHNPEGSGLGLYVVKSYIEGWGGTVTVESAEKKGTTFTIRLPILQKKGPSDLALDRSSGPTSSSGTPSDLEENLHRKG